MRINIQKINTVTRALDWALAAGTLVVGLWMQSAWIIAMGIAGFGLAWYNPGQRAQRFLAARLIKPARQA